MKELLQFLFLVDLSGSMVGENIAITNAVFQESLAELSLLKDSGFYDVGVSVFTFSEKFLQRYREDDPENIVWSDIQIVPEADGLYGFASRKTLYEGLDGLLSAGEIRDGSGGRNTYIFLLSDGRLVDPEGYEGALHRLQKNAFYTNAAKYAAFTAGVRENNSFFALEFTGGRTDGIMAAADVPGEISKLRLNLYADGDQNSMDTSEFQ